MNGALVVLDAGTGGAKCALFDPNGGLLAMHREPWSYSVRRRPDLPFGTEVSFDPLLFWDILCRCSRKALKAAGSSAGTLLGVAATSQRQGCVFLAADGTELYAGPNVDSRGFSSGLEIMNRLGPQRLYEITGHSAPFIFPLARYLWFRENDRRTVARLLMINDWITYRLCGTAACEPSNATESMLFDLRQRAWSAEILSTFDIDASVLPPVLQPGERVGSVNACAAAATGLPEGTPVYIGGADTQCALLGIGAIGDGDTAAVLGTTAPVQTVLTRPLFDPTANLWAGCHVVPERWVLESNAGDVGGAYEWLLDILIHDERRHGRADELARLHDSGGAFTYLGPSVFDIGKTNFDRPGGILFPFPSLHQRPQPGQLLRAFLESVAFSIRANVEQIEALTGRSAPQLIVGGGMSRSALLLELVADVSGRIVRCAEQPEATALGCAMLIAAGAGVIPDLATAPAAMARHYEKGPDEKRRQRYESAYRKWRELYDAINQMSIDPENA